MEKLSQICIYGRIVVELAGAFIFHIIMKTLHSISGKKNRPSLPLILFCCRYIKNIKDENAIKCKKTNKKYYN